MIEFKEQQLESLFLNKKTNSSCLLIIEPYIFNNEAIWVGVAGPSKDKRKLVRIYNTLEQFLEEWEF